MKKKKLPIYPLINILNILEFMIKNQLHAGGIEFLYGLNLGIKFKLNFTKGMKLDFHLIGTPKNILLFYRII